MSPPNRNPCGAADILWSSYQVRLNMANFVIYLLSFLKQINFTCHRDLIPTENSIRYRLTVLIVLESDKGQILLCIKRKNCHKYSSNESKKWVQTPLSQKACGLQPTGMKLNLDKILRKLTVEWVFPRKYSKNLK